MPGLHCIWQGVQENGTKGLGRDRVEGIGMIMYMYEEGFGRNDG